MPLALLAVAAVLQLAALTLAGVCAVACRRDVRGFAATLWLIGVSVLAPLLFADIAVAPGTLIATLGAAALPAFAAIGLASAPVIAAPALAAGIAAASAASAGFARLDSFSAARAGLAFLAGAAIASELAASAVIRLAAERAAPGAYCLWREPTYKMFVNGLKADDYIVFPHARLVRGDAVFIWSFREGRFDESRAPFVTSGARAACDRRGP